MPNGKHSSRNMHLEFSDAVERIAQIVRATGVSSLCHGKSLAKFFKLLGSRTVQHKARVSMHYAYAAVAWSSQRSNAADSRSLKEVVSSFHDPAVEFQDVHKAFSKICTFDRKTAKENVQPNVEHHRPRAKDVANRLCVTLNLPKNLRDKVVSFLGSIENDIGTFLGGRQSDSLAAGTVWVAKEQMELNLEGGLGQLAKMTLVSSQAILTVTKDLAGYPGFTQLFSPEIKTEPMETIQQLQFEWKTEPEFKIEWTDF
ncbi:uncharacterized protein LOC129592001 [Paramacrobiotus metropolitanus]|uniref:uncharacterized protein LOC129592001 n=1 Tax=Paramacrobiotus metropolitanus TaxID=2943436 RepID=UPI0024463957|nr:uncharacterized protein LOC129592001 [Paramacrobiotus metropolitanus]XP_055343905.1 uncharacterized protein LOC129592001 [Paramacrobiotus metropolitanus]XP_055343906.1 uncharacterized protein LOC129592001 [Paramacrobiotus metropolitanus]XP_055343907.1 uncharacterized protein LOC129592001 [Paramacrobiotus metropolitanus]XP_055343908.1 uncharacterized protein LOC129592001 [Paramacrobiotus metropolitanus]XP_055343909.1 uncharacterized protein LOC129592001 [Paramacrobiotus metropolitanus]